MITKSLKLNFSSFVKEILGNETIFLRCTYNTTVKWYENERDTVKGDKAQESQSVVIV